MAGPVGRGATRPRNRLRASIFHATTRPRRTRRIRGGDDLLSCISGGGPQRHSPARLQADARADDSVTSLSIGPTLAPSPRPPPTARTSSTRLMPSAPPRPPLRWPEISLLSTRTASRMPPDRSQRLCRTLQTPRPRSRAPSPEETRRPGRPGGARDHHACLRVFSESIRCT